jgi:hypothetical protein
MIGSSKIGYFRFYSDDLGERMSGSKGFEELKRLVVSGA